MRPLLVAAHKKATTTAAIMPLETASHVLTRWISPATYLPYLAAVVGAAFLRKQAAGYVCKLDEVNLRDRTWIISGGLSGPGLVLLLFLAERGAQVIVLAADTESHDVQQLIHLVRSSTSNERVYAEACVLSDAKSRLDFAKRWAKDARGGMVGELEARIDGIVFCDDEEAVARRQGVAVGRVAVSSPKKKGKGPKEEAATDEELFMASLALDRFRFLHAMLPHLLRHGAIKPLRVINVVSPWYAAGQLSVDDPHWRTRRFPAREPWVAEGTAALASIALTRRFTRTVEELNTKRTAGDRAAICSVAVSLGFTRASVQNLLRGPPRHERFTYWGLLACLILGPFIWLIAKSGSEAAEGLFAAVLAPMESAVPVPKSDDAPAQPEKEGELEKKDDKKDEVPKLVLKSGVLYREGRPVLVPKLNEAHEDAFWKLVTAPEVKQKTS